MNTNICEPLVRLTAAYEIEPLLATRWEYRGNNTWRFHLRPNVFFSNGRRFDADAVRWTIAVAARREPHTFLYADSVKIIDPLTVDLTPRQKNLRLIDQLVHPSYAMLAPGSEPANGPIGTGPFKLAGYKRDEFIAVERNRRYWGPAAKARRLVFRFLPDDATRVLSLRSGQSDLILDVPRPQATYLAQQPGLRVVAAVTGRVAALFLNRHGPPTHDLLKNVSIRQAIAAAIDRRALLHDVWANYGELVATLGPPQMLGRFRHEVAGIPYDPRRANTLLEQGGWKRGTDGVRVKGTRRLSMRLIAWPEFDSSVLEFIQGQLAAVGIEVHVMRFPDQPSYEAVLNRGAFDLDLEAGNQNDADPLFLPALRFYSKSPIRSTPYFVAGERFDRIIVAGLETTDRAEVQRRSAEAMHVLVDEDVIVIPLAGLGRMYAMSGNVQGFSPHPSQLNQQWSGLFVTRGKPADSRP